MARVCNILFKVDSNYAMWIQVNLFCNAIVSSNIVTILEKSYILASLVLPDLRGPDLAPDCLLIKVNKRTDYGWVRNQTLV